MPKLHINAQKVQKKKLQQEVEDLQIELDSMRNFQRELEKKQRRFDALLAEERTNLQNVTAERDEFAQETRDRETRILILNNEMEGMRKTNEDLQRVKKQLEMELDEIMQNKDDVGKNTFELEKAKRQLEQELSDLRTQVEELEDGVQLAEDARLRLEVNQQAVRNEYEQQLTQREHEEEERRRVLQKQLRETEIQLEDERRAKNRLRSQNASLEEKVQKLQDQMHQDNLEKQNVGRRLKSLAAIAEKWS